MVNKYYICDITSCLFYYLRPEPYLLFRVLPQVWRANKRAIKGDITIFVDRL